MKTDKLDQTKQAIVLLLGACGPCSFRWIYSEVKTQAYVSKLPQAMQQLLNDGVIRYDRDTEEETFEIND